MLAWVRLSLPFDDTCVERVREELVDRALRERPSANATALLRPEAPRVGRNLPNLTNWIRASEHQLPHSAHQEEAFRILDDGFCRLIVQIADGRQVRAPAVLSLGPVSAADVLAQGIHLVFRVPEDDREHELALRIVLERERRELHVLQDLLIEKVNDVDKKL